jgi:hypothetical protein
MTALTGMPTTVVEVGARTKEEPEETGAEVGALGEITRGTETETTEETGGTTETVEITVEVARGRMPCTINKCEPRDEKERREKAVYALPLLPRASRPLQTHLGDGLG